MNRNDQHGRTDNNVLVPEVLTGRGVTALPVAPTAVKPLEHIAMQPMTWGDVRRVGRYKDAMAHYATAMGHAATASGHALKIASNACEIKKLSLQLWEFGEGILTKVEQHRLERDRIKQERFLLKQTEGMQVAIAQENLDRAFRQVQYGKIEDEADHLGRMKIKEAELGYTLRERAVRRDKLGEGAVDDAARREAIANRTVLDVAEQHVICDNTHVYHPAAAIWYWGSRRRGHSHDQAFADTVRRLVARMENDPISLPEATKDMKKWLQMHEELREEAANAQLQADLSRLDAERQRQRDAQLESERLRAQAARDRRAAAEVNFDTFAGGDVGDAEN